jgi:hypothetical protein
MRLKLSVFLYFVYSVGTLGYCQTVVPNTVPTSVDAKLVIDAAGPDQRRSLTNVYLIACPMGGGGTEIGTGFLIDTGVIVTNAHVTATCDQTTLFAISTANERIRFSTVIKDQERDLALLLPTAHIGGGFRLAANEDIVPGTEVSTWGYPFFYNGVSPLLSVGYVSGYRTVQSNDKNVKHIVINGAFNHGNSGGAILVANHTDVVGIVVATYHFYPPEVKQMIDALSAQQYGLIMGSVRQPDGTQRNLSEAAITAMVLNEFYEKTQVMIGEAIAVSELKGMLRDHARDIGSGH